jgi:hypothetical protein
MVGAAFLASSGMAQGAEQDNSIFEGGTNTYNNWIELSAGGFLTSGNQAQAEERHRLSQGAFGGIEDLHLQTTVATNTTFSLDGRGIYDNHDYRLSLGFEKEESWFLRLNFENFRTWYNDDGGFYPPTGLQYSRSDDALTLDRGEMSFKGGLKLKENTSLTFNYTHAYRDGEKSSTSWGQTHPLFTPEVRGLSPSFYDIDEKRDILELDVTHHIKATDLGVGLRYEIGDLNNATKIVQFRGEPADRKITDRQGVSYDMFNVHAFSETWIRKNLFFSTGFMFANLDNDFSGSRIYGSDFDVSYAPNALNGQGYYNLSGGSHKQEYVLDLNLMATLKKHLTIVPSVRVQKNDWNADSSAISTSGNASTGLLSSKTDGDALDVRERLDVRYSGITNWVFWTQGEWTQGQGSLDEDGGIGLLSPITRKSEDGRFFQKYSAGCKWYPARRVSVDVGGYYKKNNYEYHHQLDSTSNSGASANRYPAYLVMQDFETYDGNVRLTLRPHQSVTLVSRYEYQLSTIHTQPDSASGLGDVDSSEMRSHILTQNISWTPWTRLCLQVGFNYVLSETKTPTSDFTQAILSALNNYWTLNFNSTLILDNKTDLNLGYTYYRSDNYTDNSAAGQPYGAGAEENGVTATIVRRLTEKLRLTVRYGYYHLTDELSGGHNDFNNHVLFTSLQYRF